MTAEDLRKSILQRAIQGKLVPQDPNDEPASVLLERIRTEKARLVKEKKIKKDKNESYIYRGEDNSYYEKFTDGTVKCIDEEIPFDIPESWEWCRLGNIVSVGGGKRIPAGRKLSKDVTPQIYIRVSDMKGGSVVDTDLHYVPTDIIPTIQKYTISKEDIYITVAGTIGKVGTIPDFFDGANLTENADKLIIPFYNKDCLVLTLNSPFVQEQIIKATTVVGQPKLAIARIEKLLVPIIPMSEQSKIVEEYKRIDNLLICYDSIFEQIELINNSIAQDLKKSILQYAIQGKLVPQIEAEGTAQELLEEIKQEKLRLVKEGKLKKSAVQDSIIYKGEDNKYYEKIGDKTQEITEEIPYGLPTGWQFCRLSTLCWLDDGESLNGERLPNLDAKYLRGKYEATYLDKGKVVEPPSKVILVDGENSGEIFTVPERGYLGSTFKILQCATPILDEWLHILLDNYRYLFKGNKIGAAIPHLNKQLFRNLIIGLPPYGEQHRIVLAVSNILKTIER